MNTIIGLILYLALTIGGYALMGVGLRLGWVLGDKLIRFVVWANRKLK